MNDLRYKLRLIKIYWKDMARECFEPVLACSECFYDHGIKFIAVKIGKSSKLRCPRCGSKNGLKLGKHRLGRLMHNFFHYGSYLKSGFGGAYILNVTELPYAHMEYNFRPETLTDLKFLTRLSENHIIGTSPAQWRFGYIDILEELREPETRANAARILVSKFPERTLASGHHFFRLRSNIDDLREHEPEQYDAPPTLISQNGRLDSDGISILYAGQDLEICLHECRVTASDNAFYATLVPLSDLRMLDLCADPLDEEIDHLRSAVELLFSAASHSYDISREIARAAREAGFHGIFYKSYFSQLKHKEHQNIAIFGHPIHDGRLCIKSINRISLMSANYKFLVGPVIIYDGADQSEDTNPSEIP